MKNILSAIVLSMLCGLASASPLTDSLNDSEASYVFDSTVGNLSLFENTSKSKVDTGTLCASSEVNKITVYTSIAGVGTTATVTNCTQ